VSWKWKLGIGAGLAAYVLVYAFLAAYALWPAVRKLFAQPKERATNWAVGTVMKGRLVWALVLLGVGARLVSRSDFGWLR
jgi:hypothetical protein